MTPQANIKGFTFLANKGKIAAAEETSFDLERII